MATTTTYYATAKFKTGYLQREMRLDGKANAALTAHVGDVLYLNAGKLALRSNSTPGSAKAAVAVGDYIVAQSDMTLGYGHVPVENRDYKYEDTLAIGTTDRMLMVFRVENLDDLILDERSVTTTT